MADLVVQRMVMPAGPRLGRLYYRSRNRHGVHGALPHGRRAVILPRGTLLRTDTYFNGFFESYWRRYTTLGRLELVVRLSGAGTVRLWRRRADGRRVLLGTVAFRGKRQELTLEAPAAESGLLFFEVRARSLRVILHRAEWVARDAVPRPVRLVVGSCTFNREAQLLLNVAALLEDRAVARVLTQVLVVDQGSRRLRLHPDYAAVAARAGKRLRVIEQDNFGGAGGFARCLLEARAGGKATHVLLMDDDAVVEPESILRARAFLALARDPLAVGGHLLDLRRPCVLVEAGNRCHPGQFAVEPPLRGKVNRREGLNPFLEVRPADYNGWWFLAVPLAVLDRVGLPLPLFLRGDDAEMGYRLLRAGVPTVPLPGVAVWHEAGDNRGGDWQGYYEVRNLLAIAALHFPPPRARTIAWRFLKRLLEELLAYDYYEAWLLCEAVADYLRGPAVLRGSPLPRQQRLLTTRDAMAAAAGACPDELPAVGSFPVRSRLCLLGHFVRNLFCASAPADARPARTLRAGDERWPALTGCDVAAICRSAREPIVRRRSRGSFVRLLFRGLGLLLRLLGGQAAAVRRWRTGAPELARRDFWEDYLAAGAGAGVPDTSPTRKLARRASEGHKPDAQVSPTRKRGESDAVCAPGL